ncbi:MAG: Maf family protein [Planctomycetaceae bacterium]
MDDRLIVLASRSPRRLELLASIVPRERIRVVPPASANEAGFELLHTLAAIEDRLRSIAAAKCDDVCSRSDREETSPVIIAADTVIVVGDRDGEYVVLGQPPEPDWCETTRRWFLDQYAGKTHLALTCLCVALDGLQRETIVTTRVTFRTDVEQHLDWYLATGEPRGKAGGYAIQGAGSIFVDRIEGSLTNVIGLPLRELLGVLCTLRNPES